MEAINIIAKRFYFLSLLMIIITSCQNYERIKNSDEDIYEGKNITNKFYRNIVNNDTTKLFDLVDSLSINKKEFKNLLIEKNKNIGLPYKIDIGEVETTKDFKNGKLEKIEYKINATVHYKDATNIETIGFIENENGETLLFSYYFKPLH